MAHKVINGMLGGHFGDSMSVGFEKLYLNVILDFGIEFLTKIQFSEKIYPFLNVWPQLLQAIIKVSASSPERNCLEV